MIRSSANILYFGSLNGGKISTGGCWLEGIVGWKFEWGRFRIEVHSGIGGNLFISQIHAIPFTVYNVFLLTNSSYVMGDNWISNTIVRGSGDLTLQQTSARKSLKSTSISVSG